MPDETPKACPWCSEAPVATWDEVNAQDEQTKFHYVECLSCRANGPFCPSKAEAIAQWNRINLEAILKL